MNSVCNTEHIDKPSSFSIWLYESHSYFRVPATSSNPEILLILFLARERRVKDFKGGMLTILSILLEESESF